MTITAVFGNIGIPVMHTGKIMHTITLSMVTRQLQHPLVMKTERTKNSRAKHRHTVRKAKQAAVKVLLANAHHHIHLIKGIKRPITRTPSISRMSVWLVVSILHRKVGVIPSHASQEVLQTCLEKRVKSPTTDTANARKALR